MKFEIRDLKLFLNIFFVVFCVFVQAQQESNFTENTKVVKEDVIYDISILPNYNNVQRLNPACFSVLKNLSNILKNDTSLTVLMYNSGDFGNIDSNYNTLRLQNKAVLQNLIENEIDSKQFSSFSFYEKNKISKGKFLTQIIFTKNFEEKESQTEITKPDSIKRVKYIKDTTFSAQIAFTKKNILEEKSNKFLENILKNLKVDEKLDFTLFCKNEKAEQKCEEAIESLLSSHFIESNKVNFSQFIKSTGNSRANISLLKQKTEYLYLSKTETFLRDYYFKIKNK